MNKSTDTLLILSKQIKQLGATDGHFTANNMEHTKGLTGVVSIYDGIKPAHMVLEELHEWAEKHNEEVKSLIEKIENDMSWNDKNPV
jgi:hypothetical protein